MNAQKGLNSQLMQAINATGKFVATQKDVATSTSSFTQALEKNQLSMRQYFRYTAAAATQNTKVFKGMFAQERETLTRASKDRVKLLQAQYIQMQSANGDMIKTLQVIPKHLKMVNGQYTDYATRMQMAAQRQQFLNKLLSQGSTQLLNFGKNTQWAGRQLMVGLTIPLTILGSTAAKTFMEMEKAVTKFSRVYGDMMTGGDATDKAVAEVQRLAKEFTKFGIAAKDTVEMAASAAAMGLTGSALNAQIVQATRLAVLGQVEQQQALETTISLTNAFGIASEDLAKKINFLNAVENQTVLSIEDLTIAIPKAGPVVKQLGGDVEDLAFFMTAMKEGGINASEGANALKSGLASMINPSKKASEFLAGLGININGLVEANKGDLKGTVVGFARALDTLDPLNRARAIEQLFGKFQFARLSTLFQNVTKDSSQAARALGLAGASVEELAILSERELGKVEDMTGNKFKKSMENIKLQLVPIGKAFLEAVTPIVSFVGRILEKFNTLSDGTKKVITIVIGVVGGLAPVLLMTFGVLMNFVANGIKLFAKLRGGVAQLNGSNNVLGGGFEYLTNQQIENLAQSNALHTSHSQLISTFNVEAASVQALAAAYGAAASQARALAQSSPGLFNTVPGPAGAVAGLPPTKFAKGGVVPGTGNKDTVPSMLTPGEVVLTTDTVKKNPELVAALLNGNVKRYAKSTQTEGGGMPMPSVDALVNLSIEDMATEIASRVKNVSKREGVAKSIVDELTKASTRTFKEFGTTILDTVKRSMAEAAQTAGNIGLGWAKKTAQQTTNPDGGGSIREIYSGGSSTDVGGEKLVLAHATQNGVDRGEVITAAEELRALAEATGDATAGVGKHLSAAATAADAGKGGQAFKLGNFGFLVPEDANKKTTFKAQADRINEDGSLSPEEKESQLADLERRKRELAAHRKVDPSTLTGKDGKFIKMSRDEQAELYTGDHAARTMTPVLEEWARVQGTTLDKVLQDPAQAAELNGVIDRYGALISEEILKLPENFGEAEYYAAIDAATKRLTEKDRALTTAINNLMIESNVSVTTKTSDGVPRSRIPEAIREDMGVTQTAVDVNGNPIPLPSSYLGKNAERAADGEAIDKARREGTIGRPVAPVVEATPEAIAKAEAEGKEVGEAAIRGVKEGATTESPSREGKEVGKDIAEGVILGLQEGEAGVSAQSSRLGSSAVPTAAETQARVDKMDLANKAFYDDINSPELRDERQILKSQDRQRRKRAKEAGIGSGPVTPPESGPSSTVALTARTSAAAEQLAVSTEQAATAQSQVVQQINDESRSRVTIKGNTINIGKARQEADRLDKEASDAEAAAARVRTEAAKWEETAAREGGKNWHTAENAKALKKLADEAEIRAAEARIKAAEAATVAAELEAGTEDSEQIIQDPVKTPAKVKKAEEVMSSGTVEAGDGMRRIVDGTDETADSSLLVADQTDELATVTGEAVDAQTQTAGNLLTGAQITDATTGNMNDVLQSTGTTGIAQDDIADSSQNIADTNRDIEKQKKIQRDRLIKMNADDAAAKAAENGIIPAANQSDAKYVNPETAMGSVEAYEEASTYTRNKKGEILFDPETGQPTTLTQSQLTKKKRGMRKEKVAKVSGKLSGGLGTAAMVAGMAGAPPQVTAALGTAATVAQFAPMIAGTGPIGLAVGAVVALGAGAYMLNKHFNDMAKKAAQFATDLSATRDGLKSIGEMAGRVGASEIMDKRRSTSQYGKYDEEIKIDNTFGNKFLGTDTGKKEKKLFQDNVKKFGSSKAVDDLSLKLATAVADGVLDAQAANSIAAELALQLKDQKIEMQIVGQLSALLGPNGEDLKNSPMDTRALIMANANNRVDKAEDDVAAGKGNQRENIASIAAYNMNNIQMATMMADQVQVEYENQKKKLEAELAATANAAKKLEIEKKISDLTAQNVVDTNTMNGLLLTQIGLQQKSFEKVYSGSRFSGKEDAYFDASRNQLLTNYKGTEEEEASKKFLNTSEDFADNKSINGLKDNKTAQTFQAKWEMLVGSKILSPSEANNYLELFSGQLNNLDLLFNASVGIHGTSKTKELLNMFAGYKDKKMATNMVTKIALTKTDPGQFDAIMEALKGIQALDGTTIDMEVLLTTLGLEGLEVLKGQMEGIEKLKEEQKKKGDKKMDLEAAKKLGPQENAAITALQANEERMSQFNNLNLEQQAEYLQKLQSQFAYESILTQEQKEAAAELYARNQAWLAQSKGTIAAGADALLVAEAKFKAAFLKLTPEQMAAEKLVPTYASGVTSVDAGPAKTPGDKGAKDDPKDFLDSLAMRIKMVRDQAFNAKKPIESMLAAFNDPKAQKNVAKMFSLFDGVQQKLIALKVPEEFRDYIAGLDAEQFDKLMKEDFNSKKKGQQGLFTYAAKKDKKGNVLKDAKGNIVYDKSRIAGISEEGKAVVAAYNEAPLDKFNIAQTKIITDADNQFKAFNKLKAAGVDTATALEMVADSALAGAIASKQYDATEIEKFAKDVKNAADATEKAAVMADLLKKNADFKFKNDTFPKLASALKISGMSAENIATVLQDPALAKQLMADLEDGKIDSKAIAEYLEGIKDEKIVEIRAKFNAGDFAAAAAPGMELVNKMFSVQEALIRTGASKASASMVANVKTLKNANEDLQLEIQQITFSKIRPIEEAIQKATRELEMNITRPIEAYQESINDLQRVIELAFERPIADINAENTILSQDMEIMNHAAEEINKRYDEQAEALAKVSEIKSQIVEQEKEQLDLADALSKGDIGAAARAVQAIRAAQAARNAENASKALEISRKNKIDSLRGEVSGRSKDEITERQYENAKTIYALENTATTEVTRKDGKKELLTRLEILKEIQGTSDKIYQLEEDREAAQEAIRKQEDAIYDITEAQIKPKQYQIDSNNVDIATNERAIEKLVSGISVLGQTKDAWDAIGAKIDASSLAGQDFDRLMGTMLASVGKIEDGWDNITDTMKKYSDATGNNKLGLGTVEMQTAKTDLISQGDKWDNEAKADKKKLADAQLEYETKKKQYDDDVALLKTQLEAEKAKNNFYIAGMIQQELNSTLSAGPPKAPVTEPTSAADDPNTNYNDLTKNAANDIYNSAKIKGPVTSDAGGKSTTGGSGTGTGNSGTGNGNSGGGTPPPGPGQNPPTSSSQNVPGTAGYKPGSFKYVPITPDAAPKLAKTDRAAVSAGSKLSITLEKQRADKEAFQLQQKLVTMKVAKESDIENVTSAGGKKAEAIKLWKEYVKAKEYATSFTQRNIGTADKPSYVNASPTESEGAKTFKAAKEKEISAELKNIFSILKNADKDFKTSRENLMAAGKVLKAAREDNYYKDTDGKEEFLKEPNKKVREALLTAWDNVEVAQGNMKDQNIIVDSARKALKSLGFTNEQVAWQVGGKTNALDDEASSRGANIYKWTGYATGGLVSSKFAQKKFNMGTDTVPAMLTPGEFVMNKFAVQSHGIGKMQAMNNGQAAGDAVYNYSISVNVKSESNPDEIARTVIAQIKSVDAQKMRGVRT
jgi:hypothetical protein